MEKIDLKKPIEKDGEKIITLQLDLDSLKGSDIVSIEREVRAQDPISPNPLFTSLGLATTASRVSGVIVDDILDLSAPDFLHVTNTVSNFLYGWVLPTNTPSET